ncbi:cyanidin-3-O-glucoside 2-O-glucuronosyltransferase [Amborella trichopoda]|nr:cyanidin-3-O-glucoside 2-O-glucuronosyltransferase [Amborella trichopoda]|eukprot:XP_006851566.2 cyanidin-3-O-glucoside 2-O-glucuronosyltransferase [Amborella trichopoda]
MGSMEENEELHVLMFPWLAHGHITPFFELAKKLVEREITVTICSTASNLTSIKDQLRETHSSIKTAEISLPQVAGLSPHHQTTKDLPPHLMPHLKRAFHLSQNQFKDLLRSLKPNFLLHDFIQPWAPEAALELKIPSSVFLTFSVSCSSFLYHLVLGKKPNEFPFETMELHPHESQRIQPMLEQQTFGMRDLERYKSCVEQSTDFLTCRSMHDIEGKFINYLSALAGKRVIPVGPLVSSRTPATTDEFFRQWLDARPEKSVVFTSFGSEYFMSEDEIKEIALGLELSNLPFIWVIRVSPNEVIKEINEVLPLGFIERVKERGLVVGWAPQGEILRHVAIGGFLTHCGWGSCMESLGLESPLITLPLQLDQPFNSRVMTREVRVGVEVERESDGGFKGEKVAKALKMVVLEREGELVRERARRLAEKIKEDGDKGVDELVKEIRRLSLIKGDENLA